MMRPHSMDFPDPCTADAIIPLPKRSLTHGSMRRFFLISSPSLNVSFSGCSDGGCCIGETPLVIPCKEVSLKDLPSDCRCNPLISRNRSLRERVPPSSDCGRNPLSSMIFPLTHLP